jgi:hypothetical protein
LNFSHPSYYTSKVAEIACRLASHSQLYS